MERSEGRLMTDDEKLRIVDEGRQSGATISEVCRRHQIARTQFYRWERIAKHGALEALHRSLDAYVLLMDRVLLTQCSRNSKPA